MLNEYLQNTDRPCLVGFGHQKSFKKTSVKKCGIAATTLFLDNDPKTASLPFVHVSSGTSEFYCNSSRLQKRAHSWHNAQFIYYHRMLYTSSHLEIPIPNLIPLIAPQRYFSSWLQQNVFGKKSLYVRGTDLSVTGTEIWLVAGWMQSHTWLHLFSFSPVCVFKCLLKCTA